MRKMSVKMVPNLNDVKKKSRLNKVSAEMLEWFETEPHFLNQMITTDESWFLEYDDGTKSQSKESHTPYPSRRRKLT